MPRVGIHCPVDHAEITDEECLACRTGAPRAGTHCLYTFEMLRGMMDRSGREKAHVSATMLTGACLRRTWLEQQTGWHANPQTAFAAWRGTMGHLLTERHPEPGCVYEQRFETVVDGQKVTGQIDKLDVGNRTITDFKTKTESNLRRLKAPQPEHVLQLNIYRWLVQVGWPQRKFSLDTQVYAPRQPAKIEVDRLVLVYWSMDGPKLMEAPVMDLDEVAALVADRVKQLQELPPVPDDLDPTESTLCTKWCAVRDACLREAIGF